MGQVAHPASDELAADCVTCPEPVLLAEPHVAVVRQVERECDGEITVTNSAVAYYQHLSCAGVVR